MTKTFFSKSKMLICECSDEEIASMQVANAPGSEGSASYAAGRALLEELDADLKSLTERHGRVAVEVRRRLDPIQAQRPRRGLKPVRVSA